MPLGEKTDYKKTVSIELEYPAQTAGSREAFVELKQAEAADKDIAAAQYRGPLHGIPWAAKDLIAYPGYKTTWGAGHFKEQELKEKATVAARLDGRAGETQTAAASTPFPPLR